jgi:hypothetical protein
LVLIAVGNEYIAQKLEMSNTVICMSNCLKILIRKVNLLLTIFRGVNKSGAGLILFRLKKLISMDGTLMYRLNLDELNLN